jgi:hypothetical protein
LRHAYHQAFRRLNIDKHIATRPPIALYSASRATFFFQDYPQAQPLVEPKSLIRTKTMHVLRWIVGLVLFLTCIVSWEFLKDEIYPLFGDLSETVHTYINFHKVKSEFDIAFKYHVDNIPSDAHNALVPKIMHHIWLQEHGDGKVEKYQESYSACTSLHKSEEG